MISFEDSLQIAAPAERVFAFVADLENIPKYQSEVVQSRVVTPGPTRIGTRFEEVIRIGPMRVQAQCEVTEFDPATGTLAFQADSKPVRYGGRFLVQSTGNGCRASIRGTAQLRGVWRIFEPLLKGDLRKGIRHELEAVKRLNEGAAQRA